MPPRSRNHREPTGPETPQATAASSLVKPAAILTQNARSTSRRIGGLPGDRIAGRPVTVVIHPAGRPINTPLVIGVLRRPVESAQYTAIRFTDTLALEGLVASIGSVGDAYDNAAAETVMGLFKNEAVATGSPFRVGPLRQLADVERLTTDYVHWYNHDRLHGELDYVPPEEYEQAYYAALPDPPPGESAHRKAA